MPAQTVFQIGRGNASQEVRGSVDGAASTGQQEQRRREHAVPDEPELAPSVSASNAVHEPRRPVVLLGDDGRVTQTLNSSQ